MTIAERDALLATSLADPSPTSRRYAARRLPNGRLEFFEAKWTENVEGVDVFHGHPTVRVPVRFLRQFLAAGVITRPEYKQLTRDLAL